MLFVDPKGGEDRHGQTRAKKLAADLTELHLPHELTALTSGDVMFMGNGPDEPVSVGIELKTVDDFVNSMHTGRLALQVEKMRNAYGCSWVVLEGTYRSARGSGIAEVPYGPAWKPLYQGTRPIFWQEIEAFICSLEIQGGVRVRRSRSETETARLIQVMFGWWSKPWHEHTSLKQIDSSVGQRLTLKAEADPVIRRMHRVAKSLDGIGYERGLKVATSGVFRSVHAMMNGSPADWQQALGLAKGKKHAAQIHTAIHESTSHAASPRHPGPDRQSDRRRR